MALKADWVDGNTYTSAAANAVAAAGNNIGFFNVKDYGAVGNGSTNDTTAFGDAITAAHAAAAGWSGGDNIVSVYVPPGSYQLTNLAVPEWVVLDCNGAHLKPTAGMTGTMITFSGTNSGIRNAHLDGYGVTDTTGIEVDATGWGVTIQDCRLVNWESRAVLDSGMSTKIGRVYAAGLQNIATTDALSDYTGVVELHGTDATVTDCEFNAGRNWGSYDRASTNGKVCALVMVSDGATYWGTNNMVTNTVCEQADVGVYIGPTTNNNNLVGVRGELCWHHGFLFEGGSGRVTACQAMWNSKSTDNTWDGFNFASASPALNYVVTGCVSHDVYGPTNKQRYGFNDEAAATLNQYVNCLSVVVDGQAGDHGGFGGSAVDRVRGPRAATAASAAEPAVDTDHVDVYGLTAQAADITSFTTNLAGTPTDGQRLHIYVKGTGARAITWGASFEAGIVALPATTTTTQRLDVELVWNAASGKWRCMAAGSAA